MTEIAEIVRFRLQAGTTPEAFIAAARSTDLWLSRWPGYIDRRLSLGPDGRWTDWVRWADLASAEAASAAFMAAPETQALMAAIDQASLEMAHEPIWLSKGD